jgi:hypothetical protein
MITHRSPTPAWLAAIVAAPLLVTPLVAAQSPAPQAAPPPADATPASSGAAAPAAAPAPSDAKSIELLAQVRKAIGGEAKIEALKTVSFEGTYRRLVGEQDMSGDLELYFGFPDKFQRVEQLPNFGPNPGPRIAQTLNGAEGWAGPLGPVPGGAAFRFGGPGGPGGGPGGAGGPGGPGGQRGGRNFDPVTRVRQLYWRTSLAMFPGTAATSGLTFTYVGKAESPDGEAEVLDAKGAGNFAARLFVDAKTHLPVMLTYQDRDVTQMRFQRPQRKEGETDEQMRERLRAEREAAGPPPPPKMVDYSMFITDHKDVGGVKIPHHITVQTGDKPTEEWDLKKAKVNPKLDDEQFKRKATN